jgi:hypothetical protein
MLIPRQIDEPDESEIPKWTRRIDRYARLARQIPTVDEVLDWQYEGDTHAIAATVREGAPYAGLGIFLDPYRYHGPPDNLPNSPRGHYR